MYHPVTYAYLLYSQKEAMKSGVEGSDVKLEIEAKQCNARSGLVPKEKERQVCTIPSNPYLLGK